jgi:hypothetical protein
MAGKRAKSAESPKLRESIPGQADRLVRLRQAYEFKTAVSFANFLGISNQRYNAFENGYPLSREVAFLLVKKFPGISLDWLYFGRNEALSLELARRLGELSPGKRNT